MHSYICMHIFPQKRERKAQFDVTWLFGLFTVEKSNAKLILKPSPNPPWPCPTCSPHLSPGRQHTTTATEASWSNFQESNTLRGSCNHSKKSVSTRIGDNNQAGTLSYNHYISPPTILPKLPVRSRKSTTELGNWSLTIQEEKNHARSSCQWTYSCQVSNSGFRTG